MAREATITRTTKETDITLSIELDGTGTTTIDTGIGFFDHMLEAFGRHGLFNLSVSAKGDLQVDGHHTVEDVGIVLGKAVAEALGDKRGIRRYGSIALPMDETLVLAAIDISGRGALYWDVDVPNTLLGLFDSALAFSVWDICDYWGTGQPPQPLGTSNKMTAPYQAMACADGWFVMGANNQKLLAEMAEVPDAERTARFHSTVVLVTRDERGAVRTSEHGTSSFVPLVED